MSLAMAYLTFYVANLPLKVSGVTAVVVMGLYGSATSKWMMCGSCGAADSPCMIRAWSQVNCCHHIPAYLDVLTVHLHLDQCSPVVGTCGERFSVPFRHVGPKPRAGRGNEL